MKIFTSAQIHELDKYTIEHEPITSLNLMERAAKALTRAIEQEWSNRTPVVVFAGPGNNGGDALAVARLLSEDGYGVSVFLFNVHNKLSADCATNKKRLIEGKRVKQFTEVTVNFDPPQLEAGMLVVDGLFGLGGRAPLRGQAEAWATLTVAQKRDGEVEERLNDLGVRDGKAYGDQGRCTCSPPPICARAP